MWLSGISETATLIKLRVVDGRDDIYYYYYYKVFIKARSMKKQISVKDVSIQFIMNQKATNRVVCFDTLSIINC